MNIRIYFRKRKLKSIFHSLLNYSKRNFLIFFMKIWRKDKNFNIEEAQLGFEIIVNNFVFIFRREASGDKDNMQITIDGGDKDQGSTSRKVARDVDIENFKVLDEVGEGEEEEKKDEKSQEEKSKEDKSKDEKSKDDKSKSSSKDPEPVDLDKVVIKKREKKEDKKPVDGKDLIIKKPSSLIAILAKRKLQNPVSTSDKEFTDQERSEVRKKCKAKFVSEDKVTEKVISMALDIAHFDEDATVQLIESILAEDDSEKKDEVQTPVVEENDESKKSDDDVKTELHLVAENEKNSVTAIPQIEAPPVSVNDEHEELDFEAEEPDKTEW